MELDANQTICRACLTEEGLFQSVFVKESSSGASMNISEMLSACATIQVNEGDGLPEQICSECSEQTVKLYFFKLRCEESDVILRERIEKGKAETVKIEIKCDNIPLNEKLFNDFKNNEFNREIDEEMWEKNEDEISYEAFKEESKIKEFESEIRQESVSQDDLFTNQEIFEDIKEKKLEIIDENIKIKGNSISPLLAENKESLFPCPECDFVFDEKENLEKHFSDLLIKNESKVSFDDILKTEHKLAKIKSLLKNNPHGCDICFEGFSQKSELKKHMKTHNSTSKETGDLVDLDIENCERNALFPFMNEPVDLDIEDYGGNALFLFIGNLVHLNTKNHERVTLFSVFKNLVNEDNENCEE